MATRFDASGDKVTSTTNLPATLRGITLCGWFMIVTDRNDWSTILNLSNSTTSYAYIQTNTTGTQYQLWADSSAGVPSGSNLVDATVGAWYFLAITISSIGVAKGWYAALGGSLSSVTHPLSIDNDAPTLLSIGDSVWTGEFLNGRAAHCKLWAAELTQAELQAEMYSILPVRIANLNRYLPMFPGATERLRDYANGYNMTGGGTLSDEPGPPVSWGIWNSPRSIFVSTGGTTELLSTSGTITASGTIIRLPQTIYAGADTPIASLVKRVLFGYSGQIGPTGEPDLNAQTILAGSIASSGAMGAWTVGKLLNGTIAPTGNLVKSISTVFSGAIIATSNLIRIPQVVFSGSITPSSTLGNIKATLINLTGSIISTGNLIKGILASYIGQINPNGEPDLGVQTSFGGSITPLGVLTVLKLIMVDLSGGISGVGNLIKSILTSFIGQVDANGNPIAGIQTNLMGNVTSSGGLSLFSSAITLGEMLLRGMFRGMFKGMR